MEGKRFLRTLRLANFLSYGPEGTEIELQPLNVLIGPNGSGKSNLIEALSLLKAAPTDIAAPIRAGGGMAEWMWKGGEPSPGRELTIETTVSPPPHKEVPLRHELRLARVGQQMEVVYESIENDRPTASGEEGGEYFYRYQDGFAHLFAAARKIPIHIPPVGAVRLQESTSPQVNKGQSILAQRRDPEYYPEITYLSGVLSEIGFFRAVNLGGRSPMRGPQAADLPSSFLLEDGSNLGMVLNDLQNRPAVWKLFLERLQRFDEHVASVTTRIQAGTVETLFHERDLSSPIPSTRLSDGTLRYLCLLTILCHPTPPPLVCIEDPEVGLHPDALLLLARLLLEASERTQLVVTTHSDVLVSALDEAPEAVVVCQRDNAETRVERLDPDRLREWLRKYSLGHLWLMGELGGNP